MGVLWLDVSSKEVFDEEGFPPTDWHTRTKRGWRDGHLIVPLGERYSPNYMYRLTYNDQEYSWSWEPQQEVKWPY